MKRETPILEIGMYKVKLYKESEIDISALKSWERIARLTTECKVQFVGKILDLPETLVNYIQLNSEYKIPEIFKAIKETPYCEVTKT